MMFKSGIIYGPNIWNMDGLACPTVLTRVTEANIPKRQSRMGQKTFGERSKHVCIFLRKNMRSLNGKCAVDKATETGWMNSKGFVKYIWSVLLGIQMLSRFFFLF